MLFEQAGEYILFKLRNELPKRLTYHNIDHTMDVYNAAAVIGKQENINDREMKLLLTAALYHDSGYLVRDKGHEEESCCIARDALPSYNYDADGIELICGMIIATKVPQMPKNHLEKILADADLDYLGRDDFFSIGHLLYAEISNSGIVCNEDDWNQSQVSFIERHRYFTGTAINLRETKKQANMNTIKALINSDLR
jgi:predicted metal-dependent HD superfamily phosphohydrolase